ncbi:hypothetical protein MMC18_002770 [Xylographa bjoerkii]|nr:hypothetical protein [Xylographa bjoerkii]
MNPIQENASKKDTFSAGPFSGAYDVGVRGVQNIKISNDGGISASAPVSGIASITFDSGLPFISTASFKAKVYGSASLTAHAGIENNNLWAFINSVDSIVLDLNLGEGGKPWAGESAFLQSLIEGAIGLFKDKLINGILKPKIKEIFSGKKLHITTIKPIEIPLGSVKATIGLDNVQLTGDNTTGDMYLVVNAGLPSINVTKV